MMFLLTRADQSEDGALAINGGQKYSPPEIPLGP
jgi:hypothetical protein